MKILKINEKEFIKKFMEVTLKLWNQIQKDNMIFGDGFIEYTDRKMEVILPSKVNIIQKKGKIIAYKIKR